jgi:hypothetical protein
MLRNKTLTAINKSACPQRENPLSRVDALSGNRAGKKSRSPAANTNPVLIFAEKKTSAKQETGVIMRVADGLYPCTPLFDNILRGRWRTRACPCLYLNLFLRTQGVKNSQKGTSPISIMEPG